MREANTYEINPNVDTSLREKPLREQPFQERRETIAESKIEDITTQIASNMRANLDPEIANSPIEAPLNEGPLSLGVLGQYFGNVEVNPQEKAPIDIYPYGEFDYEHISIQELDEDFTPEKLVSTLLWSSAMLKLPVEIYKSPMDLEDFRITPEIKEEILKYMLKKDNKEVSDAIKVISKQPAENITDEDIEYLVKARKNRGGITKENVDKEASRVRGQIKPLLLEDKWENLPPEVLSHVLSIGAQKETVELGDLVSDVYPAFDKYREDINEALKLAFLDKERFIEKYIENDTVRERFNRFVYDLRNKVPHLSYKTAVALSSMVLMVAACSPIISSTPEGTVSGGSEIPGETIVLETEEETSPTPIVTETSTPTPFPTPIETEAPDPTAIIIGGTMEDIERNMKEGDLIWSMVELQKIVNSFDKTSGQEFSEYIAEVRQAIPSDELSYGENYWGLDRVLEKLENSGEISTMSLIYALKDSFPTLLLPSIPEGYNSLNELLEAWPEDFKQEIIEYREKSEEGIDIEPAIHYGLYGEGTSDDSRGILIQHNGPVADLIVRGEIKIDGYDPEDGFPDFINAVIVIEELEKDGTLYPLCVMVDEEQQVRLIILSKEEENKIFTGSYRIFLVSSNAVHQAIRRNERR